MGDRGGFSRGFSYGQRRSRGQRRGRMRGANEEIKEWIPVTKLGRLVKEGKITSLEEIYVHSLPIKEAEIIDFFFEDKSGEGGRNNSILKDEVMKIKPVQKQTKAGQRTRFKAYVVIGDHNGHVGVGVKCSKEVASAIRGAITWAKLSIIPIRRGFWGNNIGEPHTIPLKVSGKAGSVSVRLIPAPRGTQIVGAPLTKKILTMAGLKDCFTTTEGSSKTVGNFIGATFMALQKTYKVLTPNLWDQNNIPVSPYQTFSDLWVTTAKENKKEALQ